MPSELPSPSRAKPSILPVVFWSYATLLVVGFVMFRPEIAMPVGGETSMSLGRQVFTVANAATLTGFQTTLSIENLRMPAQWTILILMIGGACLSWIGGGVLVARALRLAISERQIAVAAAAMILLAISVGAATTRTGDLFNSIFRSISAVTNAGLWVGPPPAADAWRTTCVWLPMAVIGAVGSTVLVELWRWPAAKSISTHAKVALALTAAAYLVGVILIAGGEWLAGRAFVVESGRLVDWREPIVTASAMSIDARSAGLPIAWLRDLSRPTQWLAALPMLAGGLPGGAAGGMKLTTIIVVAAGLIQILRGIAPPTRVFAIALTWMLAYIAVVFVTFVALLNIVGEMPGDRLLLLSISAVGNVGLSHDAISVSRPAAYVLSGAMLAGRILPLMVLWWLSKIDETVDVAVG
jgi:trk system potassium uptake protein TrkH